MNYARRIVYTLTLLIACAALHVPAVAQNASDTSPYATADGVVRELYDLVTFDAGTRPDWERVKALFLEPAVIVLRTSRDATTVFALDGFVEDFVRFIDTAGVDSTGFVEEIVRTHEVVIGDIAHVLVLYEASIPGWGRPPMKGVDSFQLIKKNDRWWIVSITNEIPSSDRPLPAELEQDN